MTIAVIKTGGKQYKVSKGDKVKVEKLAGEVGDKIEFDQVLLVSDEKGAKLTIGQPTVKDKTVSATIVAQERAPKVTVIKYKRKTRYRKKQGHRQPYTQVEITNV